MNIKKFAKELDGVEYREELTKEQEEYAKNNNWVVIFGASDDLVEFRGKIHDEIGAFGGGNFFLTKGGFISYHKEYNTFEIDAKWDSKVNGKRISWNYETDIPHEEFNVMEGEDIYCVGIVIDLNNLGENK